MQVELAGGTIEPNVLIELFSIDDHPTRWQKTSAEFNYLAAAAVGGSAVDQDSTWRSNGVRSLLCPWCARLEQPGIVLAEVIGGVSLVNELGRAVGALCSISRQ